MKQENPRKKKRYNHWFRLQIIILTFFLSLSLLQQQVKSNTLISSFDLFYHHHIDNNLPLGQVSTKFILYNRNVTKTISSSFLSEEEEEEEEGQPGWEEIEPNVLSQLRIELNPDDYKGANDQCIITKNYTYNFFYTTHSYSPKTKHSWLIQHNVLLLDRLSNFFDEMLLSNWSKKLCSLLGLKLGFQRYSVRLSWDASELVDIDLTMDPPAYLAIQDQDNHSRLDRSLTSSSPMFTLSITPNFDKFHHQLDPFLDIVLIIEPFLFNLFPINTVLPLILTSLVVLFSIYYFNLAFKLENFVKNFAR